jgi:hypothetical protein
VADTSPAVTADPLPTIAQDLFCQTCGYNLRGLTGNRCPECGGSLDGVRSLVPQIPWVYRKETGWCRAYWRTVWFVMFRQASFCDEMARPVSHRDSQLFRWVNVALGCVPVFLAGVGFVIFGTKTPTYEEYFNVFWSGGFGALWHACVPLYFAAATGVPSYFFHPRGIPIAQQNRAIALSYYACGPLALSIAPVGMAFVAIVLSAGSAAGIPSWLIRTNLDLWCWLLAVLVSLGLATVWWLDLIHLARRLVPQRPQRAVYLGMCVPILWFFLAIAMLVALPLFVLYVIIIFASLS